MLNAKKGIEIKLTKDENMSRDLPHVFNGYVTQGENERKETTFHFSGIIWGGGIYFKLCLLVITFYCESSTWARFDLIESIRDKY